MELVLERKNQPNETLAVNTGRGAAMLAPSVDEDYWEYRVKVSDRQAVIGFPKFNTIGIGFAVEDYDWNTNLPYTCDTATIYNHIKKKGPDRVHHTVIKRAIAMIQEAATADRAVIAEAEAAVRGEAVR